MSYGIELWDNGRPFNLIDSAHVWGTWKGFAPEGNGGGMIPVRDVRAVPGFGGGAVDGLYDSGGWAVRNHYSVFGVRTPRLWHSCYHLISTAAMGRFPGMWSNHFAASVPGGASVYHEESGFLYTSYHSDFVDKPYNVIGEVSSGGNVIGADGAYGVQIGGINITADRKIMRLLKAGTTNHIQNGIHSFYFHSPTRDFAVYFVPLEGNVPTRSAFVRDAGGGTYEAFFVGSSCRVAVYEMKAGLNAASYGIQIFNEQGNIALESGDRLMVPEQDIHIPASNPGELYDLGAYSVNRLFNMHCIRYGLRITPREKSYVVWRDCVFYDTAAGRMRYQLRPVRDFVTSEEFRNALGFDNYFYPRENIYIHKYATSLGVIDATTAFQ